MSDRDDPATRNYRTPPIEHRFRKGVSGNIKGRPRKKRAFVSTKVDGEPGIGFEDRIKSLAIEEAYRLITIREGDRVERIPVIQAILRKVAVAAANGNTRAQQNYLNLLIGAEADRRAASMELLKAAVDYKEHWHHVLAECARTGTTGPEPVPHPDDVLIDYETGYIRIDGPVMEEQKQARDQLRAMWPKLERELMGINEQIESDPNNLSLRRSGLDCRQRPVHRAPFGDQADAGTKSTASADSLAQTCDGYLERLFQAIAPPRSTSRVTIRCSAPAR